MSKINRSKIISENFGAAARASVMLLEPWLYALFMELVGAIQFYTLILPSFLTNCAFLHCLLFLQLCEGFFVHHFLFCFLSIPMDDHITNNWKLSGILQILNNNCLQLDRNWDIFEVTSLSCLWFFGGIAIFCSLVNHIGRKIGGMRLSLLYLFNCLRTALVADRRVEWHLSFGLTNMAPNHFSFFKIITKKVLSSFL